MTGLLHESLPIELGPPEDLYKQQCISDRGELQDGAKDAYRIQAEPVGEFEPAARAFIARVTSLGYTVVQDMPREGSPEAWFTFRNKTGTLIEVLLDAQRSIVHVSSRCYEYDWPELTPTPSPSQEATPDG